MKTTHISKTLMAITVTTFVSVVSHASAFAMQTSETALEKSQDTFLLSKQAESKDTVFSSEMLAIDLKIDRDSTSTRLIQGEFEETGSEFDGFNYNFN